MVVTKNRYSVRLVEAETKKPFKEHTKDNKNYSEAEPGAEYYIEVEILRSVFAEDDDRVYIDCEVDGVDLGYYCDLSAKNASYIFGGLEKGNGIVVYTALRFDRPTLASDDGAAVSTTMMGEIRVQFWEAIYDGEEEEATFSSDKPTCELEGPLAGSLSSKMVRSKQGLWSESEKENEVIESYSPGQHLETITIHYCTALGLIHVGVLPKPPLWECARLNAPMKGPIDPRLSKIQPKKIRRDADVEDGVTVMKAKEWDLFDLTNIDTDTDPNEGSDEEDSDYEEYNPLLDLKRLLEVGAMVHPMEQEKKVDKFFIKNFHGKPYQEFHSGYRRKVALKQTANGMKNSDKEYGLVVKRHQAWESSITSLYFAGK